MDPVTPWMDRVSSRSAWIKEATWAAAKEHGRPGPAVVTTVLTAGVWPPGSRTVPLVRYDGRSDLGAFLAQFYCAARGNGWYKDESGIHLMAALHSVALEVLTAMPGHAISVETLITALKSQFGVEQQRFS